MFDLVNSRTRVATMLCGFALAGSLGVCPLSTNARDAGLGWPVYYGEEKSCGEAELAAGERPVICFGAELYGAFHRILVEDDREGYDTSQTDYRAIPVLKAAMPEVRGWQISGILEFELDEEVNETTAAYLTFGRDNFALDIGLIDVGGIDQGNEFITELGAEAEGDYGDRTDEQAYLQLRVDPLENLELAVAYSVRQGNISAEEDDNEGNISHYHVIFTWETNDIVVAGEVEHIDFSNNDQNRNEEGDKLQSLANEDALGLGFKWKITESIAPFVNYGLLTENNEEAPGRDIKTHELTLGADLLLTENTGLTLAWERINDNARLEDGSKTPEINNAWIALRYSIGHGHIGLSWWWSDQQANDDNDNVSGQLDLEAALIF